MDDIRLNVPGVIIRGRWSGQTILIQDKTADTGGCLVLIGPDANGNQAGDIWIEGSDLHRAFDEAAWIVDWPGLGRDPATPGGEG